MLCASDSPGRGGAWTARATTCSSASPSNAAASSQSQTPSGTSRWRDTAISSASRVLPTPPTPVSVTSLASSSVSTIAARSASRPTKELSCVGRLPRSTSSEFSGRERPPQIGVHDLEHPLGPGDVAQAVFAEVEQRGARVELVARQLLGRERHHHLAPVRGAHQPRGAVERRPVVVAVTLFGGAGVDAHADEQVAGQPPVRATEGALCRQRGAHGVRRAR